MKDTRVAIIGDNFMLPGQFESELHRRVQHPLEIHAVALPWPDQPMEHGYQRQALEGLREYQGEPEQILGYIGNAEILITHLAPLSATMLQRLPELRMVAVSRGGPVNIDRAAARAREIRVVNTPGRNATAVVEFTIAAIILQTRNIIPGHEALRHGDWRGDLYRADRQFEELSGLTIGVIGCGHIGSRLVRLLTGFGGRILVNDPYVTVEAELLAKGVEQVTKERLLQESDIVSLHARVTEETMGFIGGTEFAMMKKGAVFINTARGPMVSYSALYDALVTGHLSGAMLETFAEEPVRPDDPLLRLPNVTLTPHIAGASLTTVRVAAQMIAEEVRRYLANEPPLNPC